MDRIDLSEVRDPTEDILWEGEFPLLKFLAIITAIIVLVIVAFRLALLDIEAAPGGRTCVTDYCPKADRRSGLLLTIAPIAIFVLVVILLLLFSVRNAYVVTSKRVYSLHNAFWRKRPKFTQLSVDGAQATIDGPLGLRVYGREHDRQVILLAKSRSELLRAKAVIDSLSQVSRAVSGGNP